MANYPGTEIRLRVDFRLTETKVLADPTTITLKVKDPNGTITSYVYGTDGLMVKEATGKYYRDIEPSLAGTWTYQWTGDGAVDAVTEGCFKVRASAFTT